MEIESIADRARHHIQEWIITGQLQPGQQLKEEEVAQRLGISRPPIREAFKTLEAEGLIVRKPRRGVYVPEMTAQDVREVYTLKATLYELAIALAMEFIREPQIGELESIVQAMEACVAIQPVDLLHYQALHQSFLDRILVFSGNVRLRKFAASLHNQVCRLSYRSLHNPGHLYDSLRYHRRIIGAMQARNRVRACNLMKAHVLKALDVLLAMFGHPEAESDRAPG
ncbi:MAG: GntR family transcriptional regulator [Desulfobacterales bacterium]|nr:MAG: GntR family transcriptional regulator [Desulfobacterales bacterium]